MANKLEDYQQLLDSLGLDSSTQGGQMIMPAEQEQLGPSLAEMQPQSLIDPRTAQAIVEAETQQAPKPILEKVPTVSAIAPEPKFSITDHLLKKEGFKDTVYDDATGRKLSPNDIKAKRYKGFPTIGYGTKLSSKEIKSGVLKSGESIYGGLSRERAKRIAEESPTMKDVARQIAKVEMDLSEDQVNALYEAGYNIGSGNLGKIVKTMNEKGLEAGAELLRSMNKSKGKTMPGLVKRREAEAKQLLNKGPSKSPSPTQKAAPKTLADRLGTQSVPEAQDASLESGTILDELKSYINRVNKSTPEAQLERARLSDLLNRGSKAIDRGFSLMNAASPVTQLQPIASGMEYKTDQAEKLQKLLASSKGNKVFKMGNQLVQLNPQTGNYDVVHQGPKVVKSSRLKQLKATSFMDKVTGQPVFLDPYEQEDGSFGKLQFADGSPVDDKNLVRTVESKYLPGRNVYNPDDKLFKPNHEQIKTVLRPAKKEYDRTISSYNKAIISANKILNAIERNNKLTPAMVKTQMPRLAGEVGNLNEFEQKVWTGSTYVPTAFERWFSGYADANKTLTPDDRKQLKEVILDSTKEIIAARTLNRENTINMLEMDRIPRGFGEKYLGKNLKLNKVSKETTETPKGKIKVTMPDGKKMYIFKNKLEAFKKKYPGTKTEAQESKAPTPSVTKKTLAPNEIMKKDPKSGRMVIYDSTTKKPLRWAD